MKYLRYVFNFKDVERHLRNKNLAIFYKESKIIQRVLNQLFNGILKFCMNIMKTFKGFDFVVSEQIIEYPLVFKNLRQTDKTILDFGGFESIMPLQLSAIGYKVIVLDQRRYPFCHPNLKALSGDLFSNGLKITDKFDVVISISTIEHLGLGRYGDIAIEDGDAKGVEILWRLVKKGGRLIASVPAGKPAVQRGYRVYNKKRLNEVFPHISSLYWFAKNGREGIWREVEADEIENLSYSKPYSQMPCEAVAFVICDKV